MYWNDPLLRLFFENAWRWTQGLREYEVYPVPTTHEELKRTEFPVEFARGMRDRVVMGRMRYGKATDNPIGRGVAFAESRIRKYRDTNEIEFLLDAANGLLLEWIARRDDGATLNVVHKDGYYRG